MILRRYRDAIARFEEIMPRASRDGFSPTRLTLARAYMAIRDEANAVRVLSGSGLPEERINSELAQLRPKLDYKPNDDQQIARGAPHYVVRCRLGADRLAFTRPLVPRLRRMVR